MDQKKTGSVLVVGAGVAGIRAALDLAGTGYQVTLVESSPSIGGILSKLDHQFPDDHCGMCKMLPVVGREYASQHCMRKGLFHDNIRILPFTSVVGIAGEAGSFEIELLERAQYVESTRCNGCSLCLEVCPIDVPDEFNCGLTSRKAIYRPVPHNLPDRIDIDMRACDRCGECVRACPTEAIHLDAEEKRRTIYVDTLILAAGTALYDPRRDEHARSYLVSPDVVTSLEFERLLSLSRDKICRPSDGRPAGKIGWLQCVGSRDRKHGRDFCSSVCCMFALKEAVLAREKGGPDVETTLFYMDLRTVGKSAHRYRVRAERESGVRTVRCRLNEITVGADGSLEVRYVDPATGTRDQGRFDMLVLSTGQAPRAETAELARLLDVALPETGFFPSLDFEKTKSPRDGVFMCGSFTGLTGIAEAIASGSAAASEASKRMVALGRQIDVEPGLPPERDVSREPSRVLVLLCRCGQATMAANHSLTEGANPNERGCAAPSPVTPHVTAPVGTRRDMSFDTGHAVDLEEVKTILQQRPGVGEVHIVDLLCQEEGLRQAEAILRQTRCNRVLFGACLPYVYKRKLTHLARLAGFSPLLVRVVDLYGALRGSVSPSSLSVPGGTSEAPEPRRYGPPDRPVLVGAVRALAQKLLVTIRELEASEPLPIQRISVTRRALVVGGGVAGMRAALSLADRGIDVTLLERSPALGGRVARRTAAVAAQLERRHQGEALAPEPDSPTAPDQAAPGPVADTSRNDRPPPGTSSVWRYAPHIEAATDLAAAGELVSELIHRVSDHARIDVFTEAEVVSSTGSLGNFRIVIRSNADIQPSHPAPHFPLPTSPFTLQTGVVILATGGTEALTSEYGYGRADSILTQSELEAQLASDQIDPSRLETLVMIQCVGSREEGALEYCSRVCCVQALKNALEILRINPAVRIFVLERDMMTVGFSEQYYTEARRRGVVFNKYDPARKPQVRMVDGQPLVSFHDPIIGRALEVEADLLVLSLGVKPDVSNLELARIFGVETEGDGFFQEADLKWRPVDALKEGVFFAGTAQAPKSIDETIVQAEAAAQRAFAFLSRQEIELARVVSRVRHALCARCGLCVEVCPYRARALDPEARRIVVDPAACQACGLCAAACPNGAADVPGFDDRRTMVLLEAALADI